jgi:hypothetical protein
MKPVKKAASWFAGASAILAVPTVASAFELDRSLTDAMISMDKPVVAALPEGDSGRVDVFDSTCADSNGRLYVFGHTSTEPDPTFPTIGVRKGVDGSVDLTMNADALNDFVVYMGFMPTCEHASAASFRKGRLHEVRFVNGHGRLSALIDTLVGPQ